jgi:hypothetical protein
MRRAIDCVRRAFACAGVVAAMGTVGGNALADDGQPVQRGRIVAIREGGGSDRARLRYVLEGRMTPDSSASLSIVVRDGLAVWEDEAKVRADQHGRFRGVIDLPADARLEIVGICGTRGPLSVQRVLRNELGELRDSSESTRPLNLLGLGESRSPDRDLSSRRTLASRRTLSPAVRREARDARMSGYRRDIRSSLRDARVVRDARGR